MTAALRKLALVCLALSAISGCNRIYYSSMQRFGKEKRDILVKRIREGQKDQAATQEQLKTTLETFQELTGFEGGNLEKIYKKLNSELEDCQHRANQLSSRIKSIDNVANDLFKEWQKEIDQMRDRSLKSKSSSMLRVARLQHAEYMRRMHQTEKKIAPVLQAFQDQVLFLKHNLNARAIQSLKTTSADLNLQVAALIKDIESSSKEADKFIGTLSSDQP